MMPGAGRARIQACVMTPRDAHGQLHLRVGLSHSKKARCAKWEISIISTIKYVLDE